MNIQTKEFLETAAEHLCEAFACVLDDNDVDYDYETITAINLKLKDFVMSLPISVGTSIRLRQK